MKKNRMNFFNTNISEKAKEYVNKVLDSTFISAGNMAEQFEKELSVRLGLVNPVSVNSGTAALHLALSIAGIGPGDEVILPAQTFIATGLVILMQGATPVFADIQLETGNIDPVSVRIKITSRTKAIIPVHWSGYPCDLDEIHQIAAEFNITVIEDAAHALGAFYKGKPIGSISQFTAFSFQAIKHLTTGDGGALCCLIDSEVNKAKRRRWFDIDRENSVPTILGERKYDASEIGYKYHLNDISAAMGLGNLEDIQAILNHHRILGKLYYEGLRDISGLKLMQYSNDRESSWWFFQLLVENREGFILRLKEYGIPASVVHLRIDNNSIFKSNQKELINQTLFNSLQVSIPINTSINLNAATKIVEIIKQGW
jgi:perosamine synthetase